MGTKLTFKTPRLKISRRNLQTPKMSCTTWRILCSQKENECVLRRKLNAEFLNNRTLQLYLIFLSVKMFNTYKIATNNECGDCAYILNSRLYIVNGINVTVIFRFDRLFSYRIYSLEK